MRSPFIKDNCKQNYDGRLCKAVVTSVNSKAKTFDVLMSWGDPMLNIPFDKFNYELSLGNKIVNMINDKYELNLLTVDAAHMTDDIDDLIADF